jgi:signal transduction histidine kinase
VAGRIESGIFRFWRVFPERDLVAAHWRSLGAVAGRVNLSFVRPSGRRRSIILATIFGSIMLAVAIGLNIGWVVINWRTGVMLVLGALLFAMLIAGVALNTIFLIREIRRNEQHDSFINAVTHELKTPVASIRLYLDTLQARELDPAKRQEFYSIMLADSDRLLGTIEQVLEAGRTGSAKKPTHKVDVDMGGLLRECVEVARLRHRLPEDAIACQVSSPAVVEGDPNELKAALSNLLDNAVKYSSGPVHVEAEVAADGPIVRVMVRDRGVGIPRQQLKQIFRRFYRIPDAITQRVKGTGLGLFIVNSIAKRHGGKVFAQSEGSGQGSTFTFELPAAGRGAR